MHFTIRSGGSAATRVWVDELPPAGDFGAENVSREISCPGRSSEAARAALEWCGPMPGDPSQYGLIGAEFAPNEYGRTVITVPLGMGSSYPDASLLPTAALDVEVTAGVPGRFYANYMLDGAVRALATASLGGGHLTFSRAAHGEVSSSPIVFGWLAYRVTRLLSLGPTPSEQSVRALLASLPNLYQYAKAG